MNKQDMIDALADKTGMSKADAANCFENMIGLITSELKRGGEVKITGFGAFSVAQRAATTGRNPRTGEEIKIPASKQPKFRPGKELKDAVNR